MSLTPLRWLELRVRSASAGDRAALLADGLLALGGRAAEERSGWYVTYVPEPPDPDDFERAARAVLLDQTGLDTIEVEVGWIEHEDWAETWKRGLSVRRVTDRIVVRPSWIDVPDTRVGDIVIDLDPGMAFGTAEHGTTRGCLRLLDQTVRGGERVFDVGSGSGILAIAAARLGAEEVVAIEGDPFACEAIAENVGRNGVADRCRVLQAWASRDSLRELGQASGIVANIESGLLAPLFQDLAEALAPSGWLIVSGILDHEWTGIQSDVEALGLRVVDVDEDGEWRSGLFRKAP